MVVVCRGLIRVLGHFCGPGSKSIRRESRNQRHQRLVMITSRYSLGTSMVTSAGLVHAHDQRVKIVVQLLLLCRESSAANALSVGP